MTGHVNGLFAALLTRTLGAVRLSLTDEKETQAEIASVLSANQIDYVREFRLSPSDIADFYLPDGVGGGAVIEVKLNYQRPREVVRQLERYAAHDDVHAVFLVSNKAMALPAAMHGKPFHFISLGRAWL